MRWFAAVTSPLPGLLCLGDVGRADGDGDQLLHDIELMLQQTWPPAGGNLYRRADDGGRGPRKAAGGESGGGPARTSEMRGCWLSARMRLPSGSRSPPTPRSRTPRQSPARTGIHPVSPADVLLVLRTLRTGKFPRCPAICRGHEGGAGGDVPACSPSNAEPHCRTGRGQ